MKVSFSGDICAQLDVPTFKLPSIISNLFDRADYRFCCLEAPIVSDCHNSTFEKAGPSLRQHKDIDKIISNFTHVTLANNHIMDYGVDGLNDTIAYLSKHKISFGGAGNSFEESYRPIIIEKDNIKVAVLCLAEAQFGSCKNKYESRPGYAWIFNEQLGTQIQTLKTENNYVICYVHAGLEMSDLPLPEWRSCYKSLIDYGCDFVVASHPHVIQGKEVYKGKYIYYSLGNFFFNCDQEDSRWFSSLTLSLDITLSGISVHEYFTKFDSDRIYDDEEMTLNALSNLLDEESFDKYIECADKEVLKHWNDYYESYFSYPINEIYGLKMKIFKKLFGKWIRRLYKPKVSKTLLYHNLNVDTHRFAITRAISLINKTY